MPFNQDTRCGTMKVEFNISVIHEYIGDCIEEEYKECWDYLDVDEGSKFWFYVCELESDYTDYVNANTNNCNSIYFNEWFTDNYRNIYSWEDVMEDVEKCSKQIHNENMKYVFEKIVEKPKKKKLIIKRPTWEDQIGFPTGVYNSYKEMISAEYGEHSEQALDLEKSFREAVELNK